MSFSFSLTKPADLTATLEMVKREVAGNGGQFSGDEKSGAIKSPPGVAGTYSVNEHDVTITITKKPFIATEAAVKKEITALWEKALKINQP